MDDLFKGILHKKSESETEIEYNFITDEFEDLIIEDLMRFDKDLSVKLNRNITHLLMRWLNTQIDSKKTIKISVRGSTRCNPINSKILMADFTWRNIQDCKIGEEVFCIDPSTNKLVKKKILEVFDNGKKQIYNIKLRTGKTISCTNNHPLYAMSLLKRVPAKYNKNDPKHTPFKRVFDNPKWLEPRYMKKEDYVGCILNLDYYEKNNYSINTYELLGFWLGDGYCINQNNEVRVMFELAKLDKITYFENIINNSELNIKYTKWNNGRKIGNIYNNRYYTMQGYKYNIVKKDLSKHIKDDFTQLLIDFNLNDKKAHYKFIPKKFLAGNKEQLLALLSGLLNSDGSMDKTKGLKFFSSSKNLINDIKIIFYKLGIQFGEKIRTSIFRNEKFIGYVLIIAKYESLKFIYDNCNLTKTKKEQLLEFLNLRTITKESGIIRNDLIFYEVNSITKANIEQTYDLTIEDNHNYIVNGIITHNSGKSLSGLAIINYVIKKDLLKGKKWFDEKIEWFVCGNQQEMINAFKTAEKSDFLLMDEKIFDNTGVGVHAVEEQLTNFDNVTAKKNIHSISITPKMFLTNNARIGLATWGRDEKHWMSRFLLYDLGVGNLPTLLGYIVIDVKPVFQDYGCYIFQDIKGCNNNARMPIEEIVKLPSYEKSTCFPKDYKPEELNDCLLTCPLYKICKHPMARYEKKKDTWIDKTLKGGLEGRQASQIMASVQLIPYLCEFIYDEKKEKARLMFRTSNKGETEEELALYISEISNISWGQNELKSIMTKINLAVKNPEQYRIYCEKTDLVMHEELMKIAGCTFELVEHYRTFTKLNKATKKASDKKVIWTEKDKLEKAKLTEMFNALEQEKQLEIISAWYHEMYKLPLVSEEKAVLENTIKRPKNEAQDLISSMPAEEVKSTLMESLDNWDEDLQKLAKPKKIRDESEDEETEIINIDLDFEKK